MLTAFLLSVIASVFVCTTWMLFRARSNIRPMSLQEEKMQISLGTLMSENADLLKQLAVRDAQLKMQAYKIQELEKSVTAV
jgi:hypothetical protein